MSVFHGRIYRKAGRFLRRYRGAFTRTPRLTRHMKPKPMPVLTPEDITRFWSRVDQSCGATGCWEWQGTSNGRGYGSVHFLGVNYLAHRVAYYLANQQDPGELLVCHKCDNSHCCCPGHLFLGTQRDNNEDSHRKHRGVPSRHVTDKQYLFIGSSTESNDALASRFGTTSAVVARIKYSYGQFRGRRKHPV